MKPFNLFNEGTPKSPPVRIGFTVRIPKLLKQKEKYCAKNESEVPRRISSFQSCESSHRNFAVTPRLSSSEHSFADIYSSEISVC